MPDSFPPVTQRPALLAFARAIGSRDAALRRDECGDWAINGRHGLVLAAPGPSFLIYFSGAARGWTAAKAAMSFATVTQDGDIDGCLLLERLPTESEGATIREKLGIPKKRTMSEQELTRLRAHAVDHAFGRQKPASPITPQSA
jgi:hypothetical protein